MSAAPLYELMVAGLDDFAVFLTDLDRRITTWHTGVENLLGYREDEWIGQPVDIIFTPEDRAGGVPERECGRALREGRAPDLRWHQRKDGGRIYVEGTFVALKDEAGTVLGFSKVMRDVTDRKRAHDDLRRAERRQALLLRILAEQRDTADPLVMMQVAAEEAGQYLRADRAGFFEIAEGGVLDFRAGWTAGRVPPLRDRFPEVWMGARCLDEVRGGRTIGIANSRIDPLMADSQFPAMDSVALIVAPIVRKGRHEAGFHVDYAEPRVWTEEEVALVREIADLTWDAVERARAEESRRASEERLTFALEAAGAVGTWDWDVKADRVYCSERFARMFSVDAAQGPRGAPIALFLAAIHPEDRGPNTEKIQRALETAGPFSADYRVVQPDGSHRWLHALGRAYHDAEGNPSRFPGTVIDITEIREMERALSRSEEFNRRILESTRDCIKVLDIEGRLLSMNAGGQRALGIEDVSPFLLKPWLDFWRDPAGRAAAEAALERARQGQDAQFEGVMETLSGEPCWWDVRVTPMLDGAERPENLLAVSRDITERKHAEEELRRARDEARLILESITDGFFVLDRDWRFTYANPSGEKLLQLSYEELRGRIVWDLFPAAAGTEAQRQYERAVREATAVEFEYLYEPWQRWYSVKASPTTEGGLSVFFREITDRRKADEELRRQWQTFDTVLSHTPDFICTFDLEGRFTYANSSLLALFHMRLEDLIGKSFLDLNYPVELAGRLFRQIGQVVETKQSLRDHTPFTVPGGETREYEYIFVPVIGADGKVEAIADSTRDVTERIRAEEREREREARIRDSARLESLGIMAGGIAHDFNNLLVGVLGNASLLAETGAEADRALAGEIVLAAERAAELTRQMLAYSGKGHFAVEVVNLNTLIRENLTLLRASLSKTVSIDLQLNDTQPGGGACLVEADRTQMQQVAMNLLINASEAIGDAPGVVTIRTGFAERPEARLSPHLHMEVPAGRYAVLEIRDSGGGMEAETVKKIFDPFFTTKFTGRGLGLAAVLGIVRGHRGDIEVESRPGAGTIFRVFLPAADRAEPVRAPQDPAAAAARAPGRTVLVVDDEEIVRKMATAGLERRGFQTIQATNGLEALQVLREGALRGGARVDAIILDLTMPVMTGEQALPLIQAEFPGIPIILSSGFGEAEILRRFPASEIAGVLQKPYTISGIVSRVTEALQQG